MIFELSTGQLINLKYVEYLSELDSNGYYTLMFNCGNIIHIHNDDDPVYKRVCVHPYTELKEAIRFKLMNQK